MQHLRIGFGRGDVAGLAITLIRTFGKDALMLVEEQVAITADLPDIQDRWTEIERALAILIDANGHMEAALSLLDQIGETSVPPMLDHAIVQLGLRSSGLADDLDVTVVTCSSMYYAAKAESCMGQSQRCNDSIEQAEHLSAASYYATLQRQFIDASCLGT